MHCSNHGGIAFQSLDEILLLGYSKVGDAVNAGLGGIKDGDGIGVDWDVAKEVCRGGGISSGFSALLWYKELDACDRCPSTRSGKTPASSKQSGSSGQKLGSLGTLISAYTLGLLQT